MMISAIIPFYNGNKYIENILKMFEINIKNYDNDFELILVNDSPDIPIELPDYKYNYQIRIITNEKNVGIQKTRIIGIQEAKGEYVLLFDQDDQISDNWLYSQIHTIGKADFCIANGHETNINGEKKAIYQSVKEQGNCLKLDCYCYYRNPIISPG